MKIFDKYLLLVIFIAICACLKEGEPKETSGTVVTKYYEPAYTRLGIHHDPNLGTSVPTTTHYSEQFNTTFRTDAGLIFKSTSEKHYSAFRENENVMITYAPLYNKKGDIKDHRLIDVRFKPK
jgi:hypothetical protein